MSLMRTTNVKLYSDYYPPNCFIMMHMKKSLNCCFLELSETNKSALSEYTLLRLKNKKPKWGKGHINPVCQPKTATDATNLLLPLIITKRNRPETILKTQSQGNKGNLRASTYKECTSKYLGRSKGDYASHRRQQQNNANSSLRQGLPSIEKQRP
ncbi:hypothetical protein BCV71DRAFT_279510, partial [Rhizopus microsporus]